MTNAVLFRFPDFLLPASIAGSALEQFGAPADDALELGASTHIFGSAGVSDLASIDKGRDRMRDERIFS